MAYTVAGCAILFAAALLGGVIDWEIEHVSTIDSVALSPAIQAIARDACEVLGIPYHLMASGAGHDAMVLARHVPAGMIFVPCHGGKSHSPAEAVDDEHIVIGTRVLSEVARRILDQGLPLAVVGG